MFEHASVAIYVRVTVNLFTQLEFDVTSPTILIDTVPLQLSVAVTSELLTEGIADAHVTVIAVGQVMVGATLSLTVII